MTTRERNEGRSEKRPLTRSERERLRRKREHEERLRRLRIRRTVLLLTFLVTITGIVFVICKINETDRAKADLLSEGQSEAYAFSVSETESADEVPEGTVTAFAPGAPAGQEIPVTESETPGETEAPPVPSETEAQTAPPVPSETEAPAETPAPSETEAQAVTPVQNTNVQNDRIYTPSWITQDYLTYNPYSRSGEALTQVNNIVIHYVGNTGSSAKANRDYFEDLANPELNPTGHGASSHFIVGLEGEIIQCIPVKEVAFANYPRNYDTISIEVCHPGDDGKYNAATYASVVKLCAYLCEQFGFSADRLIRHYDVSGKLCPLYYVEHEDAWIQLKEDVRAYMAAHPDVGTEMP